jgi:predicted AlkP superfamily phosphohydrolase/phosphomutase
VAAERVVVIGLDGLDPALTEKMMAAGMLPHLAALREEGGYARVATTWPAQTPVAWSTFAVGGNPGMHGIFDFLTRDPATYLPQVALYRHEQKSRFLPPQAINLRGGRTVWERLSDAGVASTILRHPCTYPPRSFKGRSLAGIGVPDLRGGFGSSTFFTSAEEVAAGEGEHVVQVRADGSGVYRGELPGPLLVRGGELSRELEFSVDEDTESVEVSCPTGSFSTSVPKGAWSSWMKVSFKHSFLQTIRGFVRFHFVGTEPFRLFASPVQFDPDVPAFPISHPWDYAGDLQRAIGPFATLGLAEEHNGLTNGRFDEPTFLSHSLDIMRERRAMMHHELDRHERGLFYCLFATPDRIQHMFWRFGEPDHPANRGEPPPPEMARVIQEVYQRCDDILGEVREYVDGRTLLMVLSDHGFSSFQREVHLNRWLHREGYLSLEPGVEPGEETGDLLGSVDWGRTSAYALGLGGLYVNLEGREGEGWVGESEAPALKQEIASRLRDLRDPERGCAAVRRVVAREDLYSGPYMDGAPDLLVGYEPEYRVASETAMGGVGAEVVTDNLRPWSGDHVVDPGAVPGVLFMNTPFRGEDAGLADLAPTILAALGAPSEDPELEGRSLLP